MNHINSHQHILLCRHWSRFAHPGHKQDHNPPCKSNCHSNHPCMPLSPMSKRSMDALGRKAWSQRIISTHMRTSCLAGIGIGLPILAANRIILLCANATVVYALTLRCYLHLWASRSMDNLVEKAWSKWIISTHMSTSCHAGIGIGLPILATNRIILLSANATVIGALTLGCYHHLGAQNQ